MVTVSSSSGVYNPFKKTSSTSSITPPGVPVPGKPGVYATSSGLVSAPPSKAEQLASTGQEQTTTSNIRRGGGRSTGGSSPSTRLVTTKGGVVPESVANKQSIIPTKDTLRSYRFNTKPSSSFIGSGAVISAADNKFGKGEVSLLELKYPFIRTQKQLYEEEYFLGQQGEIFSGVGLTDTQKKLAEAVGYKRGGTYGELQTEIETQREQKIGEIKTGFETGLKEYVGGLQTQINTGELPYETALRIYESKEQEINKQFGLKIEDVYKENPDIKGIYTRKPSRFEMGKEMLQGLITYPTGIQLAIEEQKAPKIVDIESIRSGKTSIAGGITSPITTGQAVAAGFLILGAGGMFFRGLKEVTLSDIEASVSSQKSILPGGVDYYRLGSNKNIVDIGLFSGKSGLVKTDSQILSRTVLGDTGKFMLDTELTQTISGKTYWYNKPFSITTLSEIKTLEPGISLSMSKTSGISIANLYQRDVASSSSIKTKKGLATEFKYNYGNEFENIGTFGSVGRKIKSPIGDEFIISRGGKVGGVSLDIIKGRGFAGIGELELKIPKTTTSITKIIKPQKDLFKVFKYSGGKKTPFSLTFQEQKIVPSFTKPIIKSASVRTTSPLISVREFSGLGGALSGYRSYGMFEEQEVMQQMKIPSISSPSLINRKTYDYYNQPLLSNVKLSLPTSLKSFSFVSQRSNIGLRPSTGQIVTPKLVPPSKLKPLQLEEPIYESYFDRYNYKGFDNFKFGLPPLISLPSGVATFPKGGIKTKRKFKRTPSFGALTRYSLGFKQPKFSKALEQTGIFERAFKGKQTLSALGPFKI